MTPMGLRILLVVALCGASGLSVAAYAFMKPPESFVVIAVMIGATIGFVYFVQRKENAMRFAAYYSAVQDFGTPVSFGKFAAAFERNGTRFDIEFPRSEHQMNYIISFYLGGVNQAFAIQSRSIIIKFHEGCTVLDGSPLPNEYHVQSRSPEFILNLLGNREIHDDLIGYNASFWRGFSVSFIDGQFELSWTPPLDQQLDGVYTVCRTAVIFHDELKKLSNK